MRVDRAYQIGVSVRSAVSMFFLQFVAGWTDKYGRNCWHALVCSAEKSGGFSSQEACCKCGGGHRAGTPFTYYVGPLVIGLESDDVIGHPVPRTAASYAVDKVHCRIQCLVHVFPGLGVELL